MQIQTDGAGSLKRIDKGQNGGLAGRMAGMQAGVMAGGALIPLLDNNSLFILFHC